LRKLWSYVPAAAVGGFVFGDADGDGRMQPGEPRLSGFRVYADTNGNGRFDAAERSTRTDARGAYHLTQLGAGRHRIRVVSADGFSPPAAGWTVSLEPGEVVRRYFAMSDA
jgi:hypothetical protein